MLPLSLLVIIFLANGTSFIMRPSFNKIIYQVGYNDCNDCKHFKKDEEYGGRCALFHYIVEDSNGNKEKIYKDTLSVRSWECIDGLYYSSVNKKKEEESLINLGEYIIVNSKAPNNNDDDDDNDDDCDDDDCVLV
jgi:hypothetical protein